MMVDIVGVGHNCIDRLCVVEDYPPEDGSTHITSIDVQGGGAVATALCAASRLGKKTTLIGPIGTDSVSAEITAMLRADGVDCSHLLADPKNKGLQSFVMVNPENGSRTKFPQRDNNPDIVWTEELYDIIRNAKVLHLDGTNNANAMAAAACAKEAGVPVSLDGCSLKPDNEKNIALASMADILIMNARYPKVVTGLNDYDQALLQIAGWGPKIVMCTLGDRGCKAVLEGRIRDFPAYKVRAVDTTGAGDVFHGAFLCAYLDGQDAEGCIRFASAVSAIKCTRLGGRAGIPTKEKALEFVNKNLFV